jgi:hypothetical protein
MAWLGDTLKEHWALAVFLFVFLGFPVLSALWGCLSRPIQSHRDARQERYVASVLGGFQFEQERQEVEQIKQKYASPPMQCPSCGAPLVLRRSARGPFFGCSRYPRCRFTRDIRQWTTSNARNGN